MPSEGFGTPKQVQPYVLVPVSISSIDPPVKRTGLLGKIDRRVSDILGKAEYSP